MNDRMALLTAICLNPTDRTPQMIFADYLDEQGDEEDSEWAAEIRGQGVLPVQKMGQ